MSRGFRLLGALLALVLLGGLFALAYNLGLSAGAASTSTAATMVVAYPFGFFHFGFWIFGLFFLILLIGLIVAAFARPHRDRGPWWGYRGWYGPSGAGPHGQGGPRDVPPPFEPMLEAWHRRAHGQAEPPRSDEPPHPNDVPDARA